MNRQAIKHEIKGLAAISAVVFPAGIALITLMTTGILWIETGSAWAGPLVIGALAATGAAMWFAGPGRR